MKTNVSILISICFFKVGGIREIMEGLPEAKKLKIGEEERNERTFLCDLCDNIFASKPSLKNTRKLYMTVSDTPVMNVNIVRLKLVT